MRINVLRHAFAVTVFLSQLATIAPLIAEQAAVSDVVAAPAVGSVSALPGQPAQQMREHLRYLDRRLRLRLSRIADASSPEGQALVSRDEIQRLRRHLRSLETRLHGWELDEATTLIRKVRALRPLVDNLERAVESPETAAGGLAGLRRALRVEWPPAPGLKAGEGDDCAGALEVGDGIYFGDTSTATPDGEGCYAGARDVWFAYSSPATVEVVADTFGSGFDTVLSVHTGCPGTWDNQIACNDDTFGAQSAVAFEAQAGARYFIRVAGCCGDSGAFGPLTLNVGPGGVISGTATDAVTGGPVASVEVVATTADDFYAGSALTGPQGDYAISGLVAGTYHVYTENAGDYLREIYDGVLCSAGGCLPSTGTPVAVSSGETTGGIDFALQVGGTISGIVTEAATGDPIPGVAVRLWDDLGNEVAYESTSTTGHYSIAGLPPGTYRATAEDEQYRDELYDDIPCPGGGYGGCDPSPGTPIEVSLDTTTGGVDFALERLGIITGFVSESATGFPISSAGVDVWDESGDLVGYGSADATGAYQAGGLDAGTYYVTTRSFGYFDELYDDLPCEPDCDRATGTPVAVSLNSTTAGIDFALERLGAIAGRVTHTQTGEPIENADIKIRDPFGNILERAHANSTGYYIGEELVPGNYTATAEDYYHRDELYDDVPCEDGDCDLAAGTPIAVSLGTVTSDIDFELERMGAISGRVTDTLTGQPVIDARVEISTVDGFWLGAAYVDASGSYIVEGLEPGSPIAFAVSFEYLDELYDGIACEDFACDLAAGTPIAVGLNSVTTDVDFELQRLGTISGQVTHALTGQPVDGVRVDIHDGSGSYRRTYTDQAGIYSAEGLVPGVYFAIADDYGLEGELYDDIPCETGCDPTTGTPIVVSLNATTPGIDFDLLPSPICAATDTELCLAGDRFRVEVDWEDFDHAIAPAFAEALTADTGYFYFRDPDNIELVVKVLDACVAPYHHFWVFAAGLTNTGVELTVTDELTSDERSYTNALGTTFQPIQDTVAFATCGATAASAAAGSSPGLWQPPIWASPQKAVCSPSATGMCLNAGRFLVEAVWESPGGNGGSAQAIQLTGDSGYFWFSGPDNVEVVVKVLDACGLAPFHSFWVFAAGLTNVEVTLRVTDTESDEVWEYVNPQGTAFQPVLDTGAFATCP